MTKRLGMLLLVCLTLSPTAFAIKDGNCWDPRTWGHVCNPKAESVTELPVEFLNEAKVRENLAALYVSDTFVEGNLLEGRKITSEEKTVYIVTLTKISMPPSPSVKSHFTITRHIVDGHPQIDVSEITHGGCGCGA